MVKGNYNLNLINQFNILTNINYAMYLLLTDHSPVEELQRCEYVCARDGHADVPTGVHVSSHSTAACFYAFR